MTHLRPSLPCCFSRATTDSSKTQVNRSNDRVKVLVLIKSLGLGGAERLLIDSLPFLNRTKFEYHVAYLLPWKSFLVPELEREGIPVHCLGNASLANHGTARTRSLAEMTLLPLALRRLLALQRRERFDVIQADLPWAGIVARMAGRWSAVPVIYTEHNLQERYHSLTRWANSVTYAWNHRVLAVSGEVAASIARWGLRNRTCVVTLPNGVPIEQIRAEASSTTDVRAELNIPANHFVVGTVAVFRSQKRLHDWLRVAAHIAASRSDVTFLLVGGGPLESQVRSSIEALGLSHCVRTPGFRPDGRRLMNVMDVYLMTSEFEGLPMALLEAMTLGKAVVSTDVGGIPEVLEAGVSGMLAPVGAIDQIASSVLNLLDDATRRRQMGAAGAARVELGFHIGRRVEAIENLYCEVLQEAA